MHSPRGLIDTIHYTPVAYAITIATSQFALERPDIRVSVGIVSELIKAPVDPLYQVGISLLIEFACLWCEE